MELHASKLIFISQINRDGSGTHKVAKDYRDMMQQKKEKIGSQQLLICIGCQ